MRDAVQRLNLEYRLDLTDEEMEVISRQADAAHKLCQRLFEVNTERIVPVMKVDPAKKR